MVRAGDIRNLFTKTIRARASPGQPFGLMREVRPLVLLAFIFLGLCSSGSGLILIGDDVVENLVPPPNGAPWQYVAGLGNGQGSGVYLGNRFVLTANHVSVNSPVLLNGVSYGLDPTYGEQGVQQIGTADLKLLKLAGDPGLLPLPLIREADGDLDQPCTIIGWGEGKGAAIPQQGWQWGGDDTVAQRWGLNVTNALPKIINDGTGQPQFILLSTDFDLDAGPDEAQIAVFDSGCGLFIQIGGVWKLAGIGADVDTENAALYDHDPATDGLQPDRSYFHRIQEYRATILALTTIDDVPTVPEPGSGGLLIVGAVFACGVRPRSLRLRVAWSPHEYPSHRRATPTG